MTSHRFLSNVVCVRLPATAALAIAGLAWSAGHRSTTLHAAGQPAKTPLAALSSGVTLEGPFTHENLSVYVVRGAASDRRDYITLDEGLAARTVTVREKGSAAGRDRAEVNELEIENRSDKWLFLQAGDIVKGGKQDRTIMTDLTLAPRSGPQPLEAFCVEHGRWVPSADGLAFRNNPGIVAGASLKRAIQSEKTQSRVWQEVARTETRAAAAAQVALGSATPAPARMSDTGTYNAIAENKTVSINRDAYVKALLPSIRKQTNAIGLAVAINGKVTSADVYASPALFQRMSEKLLNSYALEGFLARNTSQKVTAPPKEQVMAFLSQPATTRAATETVGKSMQRATRESDEIVMYEYGHVTRPAASKPDIVVVHQSYLKK
jgi:ARG and Rhodanese-Phosphatase-superfamily-associated Protein domain